MYLSRIACIFLVCVVVLSVIVVKLSNVISIVHNSSDTNAEAYTPKHLNTSMVLGADPGHLMWFIQISDLHLSIFHDANRINDLREFCNTTLTAIRPVVVLASGDLADGKAPDHMGSDQYIQEWEHYQNVLESSKVLEKTVWLDIRGNHDNFNVPGIESEKSYYHRYSIQGKKHFWSYMRTIKQGSDNYSFVGVDASLEPGPRRPFNFIGTIRDDQYTILEQYEKESRSSTGTIWFGHYPTSCIISPNPGLRYLMRHGAAYMCGHLHTLGGLIPKMYTLQRSGLLELELGDWKDNRIFRVAAFDHGLFTFTDVLHKKWPVVLITNPKHSLFTSGKEPIELIRQSTHIRLLVFSPHSIEKVHVRIDNEVEWLACHNVRGPLYIVNWNPLRYISGIHYIHVYASDSEGNDVSFSQPFSVDGSTVSFSLLARIILMTDAREIFQAAFAILVIFSVLPLILLRGLHILVKRERIAKPIFPSNWYNDLIRKLWVMSTIDRIFLPLVIYPLYLVVGPWFIGEVIEGNIGAVFAWGTYVKGVLLPGSFTYFYGTIQLFWFHIPFVIVLSHCVDCRFRTIFKESSLTTPSLISRHIPCAVVLLVMAIFAYAFWQAYGGLAFLLGPLRTWPVVFGVYLWYFSCRLQRKNVSEAHSVLCNTSFSSQNGSQHMM